MLKKCYKRFAFFKHPVLFLTINHFMVSFLFAIKYWCRIEYINGCGTIFLSDFADRLDTDVIHGIFFQLFLFKFFQGVAGVFTFNGAYFCKSFRIVACGNVYFICGSTGNFWPVDLYSWAGLFCSNLFRRGAKSNDGTPWTVNFLLSACKCDIATDSCWIKSACFDFFWIGICSKVTVRFCFVYNRFFKFFGIRNFCYLQLKCFSTTNAFPFKAGISGISSCHFKITYFLWKCCGVGFCVSIRNGRKVRIAV